MIYFKAHFYIDHSLPRMKLHMSIDANFITEKLYFDHNIRICLLISTQKTMICNSTNECHIWSKSEEVVFLGTYLYEKEINTFLRGFFFITYTSIKRMKMLRRFYGNRIVFVTRWLSDDDQYSRSPATCCNHFRSMNTPTHVKIYVYARKTMDQWSKPCSIPITSIQCKSYS